MVTNEGRYNTNTILLERYIYDQCKRDIDRHDRATAIRQYMDAYSLSGRAFAAKFNIPKSTVEDWLLYDKISKEQYARMLQKGHTDKTIYKLLRQNKMVIEHENEYEDYCKFDVKLQEFVATVRNNKRMMQYSNHTLELLRSLVNECNHMSFKIENADRKTTM